MEEEKKNTSDAVETVSERNQEISPQVSIDSTPIEVEATIIDGTVTSESHEATSNKDEVVTQIEDSMIEGEVTETTKEVSSEKIDSEIIEGDSLEKQEIIESETITKSEEIKEKISNHLNWSRYFNRVVRIIAIVAILIFFVWLTGRESTKDELSNSNVNISVSDEQQDGTVNVIEEVNGGIKIEESSVATIRPLTGYVISAYYLNIKNDPEMKDCGKVYELKRQGEKKYDSHIVNTIRGLLTPLSAEEESYGFSSAIPANTFLQYVKIDNNGNAKINLSGQITKVAGSCVVTAIRAQITQTLMQFNNVKTVTICINENCKQDEILQP